MNIETKYYTGYEEDGEESEEEINERYISLNIMFKNMIFNKSLSPILKN